ncbi:MAG: NAD(P)-binding protein [Thiogranum sp.]
MKKQRIAIIGGGVSGLAVAYNLLQQTTKFDCEIDIYEANDYLGGNADTALVDLGERKDPHLTNTRSNESHLIRKADLGVDDLNMATYTRIVRIMAEIGFTDYRPLEDTACFFTLNGSKVLTADGELQHGTSDPNIAVSDELASTYSKFIAAAATDIEDEEQKKKYKRYTVGQYVAQYMEHSNSKDIPMIEEMRDCLLYPRINAMYFADDVTGPAGMPLRAVMRYYIIQEGFKQDDQNPPKPKRNYFLNGAQAWIDTLAEYLLNKYPYRLKIIRNAQASIRVEKSQVSISVPPNQGMKGLPKPQSYDKVVMTCHADDAMRAIKHGMSQGLINVLDKVRYTNSIAVAHTFAGVLAPDRNAWRTYNVLIREGQAIHPYSMTYVMNRHRNDAAVWYETDAHGTPVMKTTGFNKAGMPQYFVTLNPCVPIPDEYVLKTPEGETRKPAGYFKEFKNNEEMLPGWRQLGGVEGKGQPVIGWFKHNVLNFDCLDAQEQLAKFQGGDYMNLYFAGGWTHGAGLHEECWDMAEKLVEVMTQHETSLQGKNLHSEQQETTC